MRTARYANPEHSTVLVKNGEAPEIAYSAGHPALAGLEISPYVPGPEIEPSSSVEIAASALFTFDEYGFLASVRVPKNLGAWVLDTGVIYCYFAVPLADADYIALAYDTGECRAFVDEDSKDENGFSITVVDLAGNPVTPTTLSVEVKRLI